MTIVDIANESGYSISTVSRVLNNRKDVSPKAKEKIMAIVEAHNFVPNNNAKNLKQTVTEGIVVIAKGSSNMLFASIIEAIQTKMEETDYNVNVVYLDELANEVEEAIRICREKKPLGILFLGGNPVFFKESFKEVSVPCVLATNRGEKLDFSNLSSVATDDVAAAEKAVDYLVENGHSHIAVLGGDLGLSDTSMQRYLGYANSFRKHGLELDATVYYEKARYSFESAYVAMKRMMDKKVPLTAVFAMSDIMAIGAVRAIYDEGLSVPEDISIVGFDGTLLADYYNPKIVTIGQEHEVIAQRSVEVLLHMIDTNAKATHELVPFKLKNTESVKKLS